jgi:hypothetical protein
MVGVRVKVVVGGGTLGEGKVVVLVTDGVLVVVAEGGIGV